ncbi:winged helix-turn-helix transcriptional regulator [Novosphingobium barchaimii]|uniref:winged helix-turn-helix transcriptional regulator n=1 Tax=Novosphingobium barchaimii TaxID=1420591 RepID=UPI00074128C1|nr:helix-turn-helix domain-containing protein [Novosphingobium barchaimii]
MLQRTSTRLADRMERGDVFEPRSPSREIMKHVTSTWGVLVLIALKPGTIRFNALRRRLNGVSERMLAQTLQQLERDRLVKRQSYAVVPPHVEYTLTDLGREAADRVEALANWIDDHLPVLLAHRENPESY